MLVKDSTRELARIVTIVAVEPIPKADRLEMAIIGGWRCVVEKGLYKPGDSALYFEIDSAVPMSHPVMALVERKYLRIIEDPGCKEGYAIIKTLKLRGVTSNGLLLSIKNYVGTELAKAKAGTNVTDDIGVLKYVSPQEAWLYKVDDAVDNNREQSATRKLVWAIRKWLIEGIIVDGLLPFPTGLKKSDQPRAQNVTEKLRGMTKAGHTVEYTIKLNGESITYHSDVETGAVGVTQRNFALRTSDVAYTPKEQWLVFVADTLRYVVRKLAGARVTWPGWKKGYMAQSVPAVNMFYRSNVPARLAKLNENLAGDNPVFTFAKGMTISVQGEGIGPDFNGNKENYPHNAFFAYNVYGSGSHRFLPIEARAIVEYLDLNYVPVLEISGQVPSDIQSLVKMADGPGHFDPNLKREGIVGKSNATGTSFKVISEKWLLGNKDE